MLAEPGLAGFARTEQNRYDGRGSYGARNELFLCHISALRLAGLVIKVVFAAFEWIIRCTALRDGYV